MSWREDFEKNRSSDAIKDLTDTQIKIGKVQIRAAPIMETLTGFMIAGFICAFLSGIAVWLQTVVMLFGTPGYRIDAMTIDLPNDQK